MRRGVCCGVFLLFFGQAMAVSAPLSGAQPLSIDLERSHLEFEVRTRLGGQVAGTFPVYDGSIQVLPDGRHQVRLRIATAAAEIPGRARYTRWMRGDNFFDALRHPWMEFVSAPYTADGLTDGLLLDGHLTLRG